MFNEILNSAKPTLIPFLMAGYPDMQTTEAVAETLIEEGVRIIEIGIPFSDPLADGPVIQKAADVALKNGTSLTDVLELCRRLVSKHPYVRIVLFTYLNPLLAFGLAEYVAAAKKAGVAATLTVDLPPEEAMVYMQHHRAAGLGTVFLASQTTSSQRLQEIAKNSSAFVYYVARAGVTGVQADLSTTLAEEIEKVRRVITSPLVIGFGIGQPRHVQEVSRLAEGVVIGSAILRMMADAGSPAKAAEIVRKFASDCFRAVAASS
jgi:tryptophan synthase alpha chain